MLRFEVQIKDTLSPFLDRLRGLFLDRMHDTMKQVLIMLQAYIRERSFFKAGLHVRSGGLLRSIKYSSKTTLRGVDGRLGSKLGYARVQEEGATIRAKKGKYLRFKIGDKWVITPQVRIPARPYIRPAIQDNIDEIRNMFIKGIKGVIEESK